MITVLQTTLKLIDEDSKFNLPIFPNGVHVMKKFGSTINEIKNDNFIITKSIDTYSDKVQKAHQFFTVH